jgi:hypothetical protein
MHYRSVAACQHTCYNNPLSILVLTLRPQWGWIIMLRVCFSGHLLHSGITVLARQPYVLKYVVFDENLPCVP